MFEAQQYIVTPATGTAIEVTKELTLDSAVGIWRTMAGQGDDKSSKPTRPYGQVDLVYLCVNMLIDGVAGIPLVLSTISEEIIESGPAFDFLYNNPSMSWEELLTQAIGHYALSRDVFFVFSDKTPGQPPQEIYVVSGTQMKPITHNRQSNGELIGWEFNGAGGQRAEFSLDEVFQWKNFNPYDRFHGLGPTSAAKLNIDYCYAATLFNSSALANGADPGIILMLEGRPDQDQRNALRENFDARHKGAANAKRTAALAGIKDVKTVAMNMVEMQMAELDQMKGARLCKAFGVPPELAGLATEAQYARGPAQRDFVFNTLTPLCFLFAGEITTILKRFNAGGNRSVSLKQSRFYQGNKSLPLARNRSFRAGRTKALATKIEIFAWFDTDQHPAAKEYQQEVADKVLNFTKAGVTLNDLIEAHDLPYQTQPWGDHYWIGMGQVPARWTLDTGPEGAVDVSLPEGETEEDEDVEPKTVDPTVRKLADLLGQQKDNDKSEQQKLRIWSNWKKSWAGIEREYKESLRVLFVRQQRELIARLKKAWAQYGEKSIQEREGVKDAADQVIARVVFDLRKENGKLKVINEVFFDKASELGIRQGLTEPGDLEGDELENIVEQVKQRPALKQRRIFSTQKITKVNRTTQNMVRRQLQAGLDKGEDLNQLTRRIQDTLGANRARALRIARTQTAGAVSTGRHQGMKAAGVQLKAWLTSRDKEVRDSHKEAGIKYAAGIHIDLPFEVGGEMLLHPGDPAGSAANIINCRCLQIARRAKGKSIDLASYEGREFYSYAKM